MKTSPIRLKQKLSPTARRAKAIRDLAAANSPTRKAKRADSQKKRRDAKKRGVDLVGKDYDHRTSSFRSVNYNRGNNGNGTKREG
tara:strand:- start:231 stop:485 length:255 start_codon:yes stop_codon:yes gene_type:complete